MAENSCNPNTGDCAPVAVANGTSCGDGDACNQASVLMERVRRCPQWIVMTASPARWTYANQAQVIVRLLNTSCDDGNRCTSDVCTATGCINESFGNFASCDIDSETGLAVTVASDKRDTPNLNMIAICPEYNRRIRQSNMRMAASVPGNYSSSTWNKTLGACNEFNSYVRHENGAGATGVSWEFHSVIPTTSTGISALEFWACWCHRYR